MKRFFIIPIFAAMLAGGTAVTAQDYPEEYLGLPGDNLNLYAVMNLFQGSETLEGFERKLNEEDSRINNLDLNNDNMIDYIKVINYVNGNVHTIILQAVLNRNDFQDVAVFTVEKLRDGSVQIQLIGDEALYGKNYIIEPYMAETPNPGYRGNRNRNDNTVVRTTYVEVAAWPVVRYIYMPGYTVWRSSWYWGYYPEYWHPWRPYYWHYYYGYHYHWYPTYYVHYRRWDRPRYVYWNDFYYRDKRVISNNVIININRGSYKTTYSRPESRQEGEALYAKVHPERASSMSTGNSRRTSTDAVTPGQAAGTDNNTGRRSSGTVSSTTRNNTSQGQGNNARRSTTTTNEGNNRAVNRSTTTVNNRANSGSTAGQSTVTNRRSSENVSTRPSSGKSSNQGAQPSRTTKEQSSGQATRRSSEKAQKETVVRQGSKEKSNSSSTKKESESSTSRRK